MIRIELPYPPSVNHYWQRGRNGQVRLSTAGRNYRYQVQAEAWQHGVPRPVECRLSVRLVVHPPDKRTRDLDNVCKAVLDALHHARLIEDDNQVDHLEVTRADQLAGGRVSVQISPLL